MRTALDAFVLPRQGGDHHCLVQSPMWDTWNDLLRRDPAGRFSPMLLQAGLRQVFLALDYLHNECRMVHTGAVHSYQIDFLVHEMIGMRRVTSRLTHATDIKADNIFIEIADDRILDDFVDDEMSQPSRRKVVNGMTIYASRAFGLPRRFGRAVLGDFGAAVRGDEKRNHNAQPDIYRSPEVMLKADWSYAIDVWNVGTMVSMLLQIATFVAKFSRLTNVKHRQAKQLLTQS